MSDAGRHPPRKRFSHALKSWFYDHPRLDAALDARLAAGGGPLAGNYLRLFPERRHRAAVFAERDTALSVGRVGILSLVPPEDSSGASRPARLAAELFRRGFDIDWRWALDIYPWPAVSRPTIPGTSVAHLRHANDLDAPSFVLVEAPHPAFVDVISRLPAHVPVLYDQIDLWQDDLALGWYSRQAEEALIERSDVLFASARTLQANLAQRSDRTCHYLPNAVDPHLFRRATHYASPPGLQRGNPTVVYVGALWGEWIDLDGISRLAAELPDAEIHLVGRADNERRPMQANLHWLGERPRTEIPAWLAHADVALIPFHENEVAAAVSPLKAFEALAMGCPVVGSDLPELRDLPGVTIASGDSLAAAVGRAAGQRLLDADTDRFVANHSWSNRVDTILAAIPDAREAMPLARQST